MSIRELDHHVEYELEVTCNGCKQVTITLTVDGGWEYNDDQVYEQLEDAGWKAGDSFEDGPHLCPDCPTCAEAGHSWAPRALDFRDDFEALQCVLCKYTPHVPLPVPAGGAALPKASPPRWAGRVWVKESASV